MNSIISKVKRAFERRAATRSGIIDWKNERTYKLWFEEPDALTRVPEIADRWGLSSDERDLLSKWVTDGYFTMPDVFGLADLEAYASEVDSAWFADKAIDGLTISDVIVDGVKTTHMPHSDLLALPRETRSQAREESNWRIGEFHLYNQAAAKIFRNKQAIRICSALLDRAAVPHFSLTFSKGSMQLLHQDTCVFHTWPMNALIGVWVALEDIKPGSGPLVYFPKSHREPLFSEFDNYPQTQRRTSPPEQSDRYQEYIEQVASKYERNEFLAKKGEVLFWHGMLVHGGADYVAPGSTRKSFVIHYMPEGGNVAHRVQGPFNW
ncbi:phytanoyl-CoA dioxygenase [Burkholderia aenigmatica]|uniref:Phytanoyl-CoA dioxygenase n=1 Tax=Burkholderia aenigmatica TaxID=2015348 RepID=A0A6P2PTR6_9BURK|nr:MULTISPECIES: phytanoyl-CoA dioxygenase family protein [Burkholderia]VWC09369.1 phytanoyl-CoA dioxygenase [Burkholderia aenigmatica]